MILASVAVLSMVNFMAFFVIAIYVGGDAVNGKVEAGRYYPPATGATPM